MKVDLGIDFGTSKIAVSTYLEQDQTHNFILLGKYFANKVQSIYCRPTISFFERSEGQPTYFEGIFNEENVINLESIKRCFYCSLVNQGRRVSKKECLVLDNYFTDWCNAGELKFDIGNYHWEPMQLYVAAIDHIFKKINIELNDLYPEGWEIGEVKFTFPVILQKAGRRAHGLLDDRLRTIVKNNFQHKKAGDVAIVEEPTAALIAHFHDLSGIPKGTSVIIDVGAGTSDVVIFQKTRQKVFIRHKAAESIGGNNYDFEFVSLIQQKTKQDNFNKEVGREIKEGGKGVYTVDVFKDGKLSTVNVNISEDDYLSRIKTVNREIIEFIEKAVDANCQRGYPIPKNIFIVGGSMNISELVDDIRQYFLKRRGDSQIINIEVMDRETRRKYGSLQTAPAFGATRKIKVYTSMLEHSLPLNILIRAQVNKEYRDQIIYSANCAQIGEQSVCISDFIGADTSVNVLIEEPKKGTRQGPIITFQIPEYTKIAKLFYEIDYNGMFTLWKSRGSTDQRGRRIYKGYPTTF